MTVPGTIMLQSYGGPQFFRLSVGVLVVPGTEYSEYSSTVQVQVRVLRMTTGTSDHISSTGDPVGIKRVASYPQLENVDEGRRICNADSLSMLSAPRAVEQRGGFGILAPSQRQNC